MPSKETLGRIVDEYNLDKEEVLDLFTEGNRTKFGAYLREHVFKSEDDVEAVPVETGTNA